MKNLLVAGGAGQFGSRFCQAAAQAGWNCISFDSLVTGDSSRVKFGPLVKVDVRETPRVVLSMKEYAVQHLVHCALTRRQSDTDPILLSTQHMETTLSLLKALREGKGRSLTVLSDEPATRPMLERILADCELAYGLQLRIIHAADDDAISTALNSLA